MNILIVDDQRAVLEGIRNSVEWQQIGIDNVYTACSAKEAKLILPNFDIDILLSDIEMPEEDGLSLFRWTREHYPQVVGLFLTSHADFDYAREALKMGCFDYILQPARGEVIQEAVGRAIEEAKKNASARRLERLGRVMATQRDGMLELLIMKAKGENWAECKGLMKQILESMEAEITESGLWPAVVQINRYGNRSDDWDDQLLKMIFRNVLEELFEKFGSKVCIAQEQKDEYLIILGAKKQAITEEEWSAGLDDFYRFVTDKMDFSVAVYPESSEMREFSPERLVALEERKKANVMRQSGIYREDITAAGDSDVNLERVRRAESYIRSNLGRGVSRTEVADYLHLNEEYFSRLFKKYTGYTFKDYEMKVRIDQAKNLLAHSHISVSIIASKVGYDNFSHFSRAFKKETGLTPQEYRKEKTGK